MATFLTLLIFALILLAFPIALALGVIGLLALITAGESALNFQLQLISGLSSFVIIAVPLFILTGEVLATGQVARRLIDFASSLVGWIPGGLGHANIVTSMMFANVSGSAVADAASVGSVLIPEMERRGFSKAFSVVVTSYSASIGVLIPPSIGMILYSAVSQVSVARLFAAGYIPGIGYGLALMAVTYVISKRRRYPTHEPFAVGNVARNLGSASVALLIPFIIIFGIVGGVFTPTEGAAVTAVLALFVAIFLYRGLRLRDLPKCFENAALRSANVLLLLGISSVFSHYLIVEGIPQALAETIAGWGLSSSMVLLVIIVFLIFAGIFLHGGVMILMLTPIFLPVIDAAGIDRVHFGMIFIFCVVVGEQTPPVASVLLTTCGVANFPIAKAWKASIPFFILLICYTLFVAYVPGFTLFLPDLIFGE